VRDLAVGADERATGALVILCLKLGFGCLGSGNRLSDGVVFIKPDLGHLAGGKLLRFLELAGPLAWNPDASRRNHRSSLGESYQAATLVADGPGYSGVRCAYARPPRGEAASYLGSRST